MKKIILGVLLLGLALPFWPVQASLTSLNVSSPSTGEQLYFNQTYIIHWNSTGTTDHVRINLVGLNGTVLRIVTDYAPNTGTYTWTVPSDISSATDYTIHIIESCITTATIPCSNAAYYPAGTPNTYLESASGKFTIWPNASYITGNNNSNLTYNSPQTLANGGKINLQISPTYATENNGVITGMINSGSPLSFTVTGGNAPYSWSIVSGTPPSGMTLGASSGNTVSFSGNDTQAGSYTYQLQVNDASGNTGTKTVTEHILPAQFYNGPKMVQAFGNPTIYFVNDQGEKRPMLNAKVFLSYGYHWSDVVQAWQDNIDVFTPIAYIHLAGSNKIYKISGGIKQYVAPSAYANLGINPVDGIPNSAVVNRTEFNSYRTGRTIK